MSYFSTIYSDNSLPVRAKTVYMYLRDRSDKERKCWPGINTIAAELQLLPLYGQTRAARSGETRIYTTAAAIQRKRQPFF